MQFFPTVRRASTGHRPGARAAAAAILALVGLLLVPAVALANPPNLLISKTADSGTVRSGAQIGFTITVEIRPSTDTNCTPVPPGQVWAGGGYQCPAINVIVTDLLPTSPSGLNWTIASASAPDSNAASPAGCAIGSGVLTCNWGDMSGAWETKSVRVTSPTTVMTGTDGQTCATVSNTANVTYSYLDGTPKSDSAQASVDVTCFTPSSPPCSEANNCSTPTPTPTPTATPTPTPTATGAVLGVTSAPTLPPTSSVPGSGGSPNSNNVGLLLAGLLSVSLALVVSTRVRGRLLDRIDR